MKLALVISFLLLGPIIHAREYQLGVVLGAPTGLSGKVELGNNRAIDGAIAYSFAHNLGLELHSDYLIENVHGFNMNASNLLQLYFGIGARLAIFDEGRHDGDIALGPRVPIGANYKISNPNLEFFGEVALDFDIVPDTDLDLDAGIGMRYRF